MGVTGARVGNGGFCVQSKILHDTLAADSRFEAVPGEFFDLLICGPYRSILEREYGIRFAPETTADLFSYENTLPHQPTFGFHGLGNIRRHADDSEVLRIADLLSPYVFRSPHFTRLIINYALQCKYVMVEELYTRMLKRVSRDFALAAFRHGASQPHADAIFGLCEQLVGRPQYRHPRDAAVEDHKAAPRTSGLGRLYTIVSLSRRELSFLKLRL